MELNVRNAAGKTNGHTRHNEVKSIRQIRKSGMKTHEIPNKVVFGIAKAPVCTQTNETKKKLQLETERGRTNNSSS